MGANIGPIPVEEFERVVTKCLSEGLSGPSAELQVGSPFQVAELTAALIRHLSPYEPGPTPPMSKHNLTAEVTKLVEDFLNTPEGAEFRPLLSPKRNMSQVGSLSSPPPEVTLAMYEAGSEALIPFYMGDGVYDLTEPALVAVYRAMVRAQ